MNGDDQASKPSPFLLSKLPNKMLASSAKVLNWIIMINTQIDSMINTRKYLLYYKWRNPWLLILNNGVWEKFNDLTVHWTYNI